MGALVPFEMASGASKESLLKVKFVLWKIEALILEHHRLLDPDMVLAH